MTKKLLVAILFLTGCAPDIHVKECKNVEKS